MAETGTGVAGMVGVAGIVDVAGTVGVDRMVGGTVGVASIIGVARTVGVAGMMVGVGGTVDVLESIVCGGRKIGSRRIVLRVDVAFSANWYLSTNITNAL